MPAIGLRVCGCAGGWALRGRVEADAGRRLVADGVLFDVFVVGAFDAVVDELAVFGCHRLRRFFLEKWCVSFPVQSVERVSFLGSGTGSGGFIGDCFRRKAFGARVRALAFDID